MFYKNQIEKIIKISSDINSFRENEKKKLGITSGLEMGSSVAQEYLKNIQGATDPLTFYLNTLPTSDLEYLVAIMYAGRESNSLHEYSSFNDFYNTMMTVGFKGRKSECIDKIVEKLPALKRYYEEAMKTQFCQSVI